MSKKYQLNPIDKAIISTLAYSQVKQWPMTLWEIFRYLTNPQRISGQIPLKKIKLCAIQKRLKRLIKIEIIKEEEGFYSLRHRELKSASFLKRNSKDKLTDSKIKKAIKIIKYLQFFPFIRGIFLSGSLIFGWANEESDIDILIVAQSNHLWTARFLISAILTITKLKRSKRRVKNRLCLNHFITSGDLEVSLYSLYNAETYARLIPLCGEKTVLANFLKANLWINDYILWGRGKYHEDLRQISDSWYKKLSKSLLEILLNIVGAGQALEKLLRKWQIKRIKKDPLTYKKGGRVAVNTKQIEFHPDSPEREHLKRYNSQLVLLGLFNFSREQDSGLI
jgi:predicted nucleotidyltransferase